MKMKWTLAWVVLCCGWTSLSAAAAEGDAPQATEKTGLTYKGVNVQLGGFLASETLYRTNNVGADIGTSYQNLTFANDPGYGMSEFRGSARQSRFSLLAQGDTESGTHLTGYYELDFLGTSPTANSNESNSFTPRTRHVYMTMDMEDTGWHLLAGQTWSLVTQNAKGITPRSEYVPMTIDAQYAVGFNWARQWQVRLTKDWNKTWWAALSVENPQTAGVKGTDPAKNVFTEGANTSVSTNPSINGFPDIIAKVAAETDFGHFEIYDLARNFESRYGATATTISNKQSAWTNAFGAAINVPVYPKVIDLSVSGLFGKGIGRYGTAQLADSTYASDGSLAPLSGSQYLAQLTWHASSEWEAYLTYGQESVSSATGTGYGYGDGAAATNAGCAAIGGANCSPNIKNIAQSNIGFWWSIYKGSYGVAKLGGQYSHTTVATYADATAAAFAPNTAEDMAFVSLRYYPF